MLRCCSSILPHLADCPSAYIWSDPGDPRMFAVTSVWSVRLEISLTEETCSVFALTITETEHWEHNVLSGDPTFKSLSRASPSTLKTFHLWLFSITLGLLCRRFDKLFSEVCFVFHMVSSGPLTHPERTHHVDLNLLTRLQHLLKRSVRVASARPRVVCSPR